MKSGFELDVRQGIQQILDKIAPRRFICTERKALYGKSAIAKPVDLQVAWAATPSKALVAVEVANVNTTQLVGETCRLYYDACPLKFLILGDRNVPTDGKKQCEKLLAKLYGQDDIRSTPARVASFDEDEVIASGLRELLLIEPLSTPEDPPPVRM